MCLPYVFVFINIDKNLKKNILNFYIKCINIVLICQSIWEPLIVFILLNKKICKIARTIHREMNSKIDTL